MKSCTLSFLLFRNEYFGTIATCSHLKAFFFKTRREESKQDSDMDEPWIMTVKGPHGIKGPSVLPVMPLEEPLSLINPSLTANHRPQHDQHNPPQPQQQQQQQQQQAQQTQTKPHANGSTICMAQEINANNCKGYSKTPTSEDKYLLVSLTCLSILPYFETLNFFTLQSKLN